ncbi:MAG: pentapeptide repeat-containing protein [Leptolyngbya sp. BL-A-14]
MKATEVLNRYANGERDFRRANLRGQNFKRQDLSGADFTEADICGANFTNAILRGVNFAGAKAGVQKHWLLVQWMITLVLAVLSGGLSSYPGIVIAALLLQSSSGRQAYVIAEVIILGLLIATFTAISYQGLTVRAFLILTTAGAGASVIAGAFAVVDSGDFSIARAVAVIGAVTVISVITSASALSVAGNAVSFIVILTACAIAFARTSTLANVTTLTLTFVFAVSLAVVLSSFYIKRCALRRDDRFSLVRLISVVLSAIGGTSFCGADLTHVNFTNTILRNTNFNHTEQKQTIMEWICWRDAKQLECARVGTSILVDGNVRDLLVTRNGYKKSYVDANLRATNLDGVNLEGADLTWADLSCAYLRQANLKDAKLIEALALDTDFTGATLTGACLEAWNVDSNTNLEGVDCQYVYLLRDQQERRPSSGDFAPGEFTKLFQEALNTVDLIFRNGVDWKAFVAAFQTVQVDNDGTELTIQSIENKGDGVVVVRVSVPETANKAKIHSEFNQNYDLALKALEAKYHAELKAKESEISIYREQSVNMWTVINSLAAKPIHVQATAKAMNNSTDESQNVNIGGNVTGSTINLGAISGSVSNVVNQLPSAPDPAQPGIKELLIELQTAIESDADLPEKGKASALEQVKVLAEVAQDPEQPEKKGLGSQAVTFFKNAASFLPDTAKLAEACTKLLPLITKALGLPF